MTSKVVTHSPDEGDHDGNHQHSGHHPRELDAGHCSALVDDSDSDGVGELTQFGRVGVEIGPERIFKDDGHECGTRM